MEKESNDISQRMAQKRRTTDASGKKAKKNIE
jgi:predicted RNase H-like nuclease (RuvC/YqgF family)